MHVSLHGNDYVDLKIFSEKMQKIKDVGKSLLCFLCRFSKVPHVKRHKDEFQKNQNNSKIREIEEVFVMFNSEVQK